MNIFDITDLQLLEDILESQQPEDFIPEDFEEQQND